MDSIFKSNNDKNSAPIKIKDPPRYPRVINHYENEAKKIFRLTAASLLTDLVKEMADTSSTK